MSNHAKRVYSYHVESRLSKPVTSALAAQLWPHMEARHVTLKGVARFIRKAATIGVIAAKEP
jgi:hypothetical protein